MAFVRPMATATSPPVEWVPAEQRWWLGRTVGFALIPIVGVTLFALWWRSGSPLTSTWEIGLAGATYGAMGVGFLFMFLFPSVRRLGFSPMYLVVDTGLVEFIYTWADLREVTRTDVRHFRWNRTDSHRRTRIWVNSALGPKCFALTPNQGARLARFLRIA